MNEKSIKIGNRKPRAFRYINILKKKDEAVNSGATTLVNKHNVTTKNPPIAISHKNVQVGVRGCEDGPDMRSDIRVGGEVLPEGEGERCV